MFLSLQAEASLDTDFRMTHKIEWQGIHSVQNRSVPAFYGIRVRVQMRPQSPEFSEP